MRRAGYVTHFDVPASIAVAAQKMNFLHDVLDHRFEPGRAAARAPGKRVRDRVLDACTPSRWRPWPPPVLAPATVRPRSCGGQGRTPSRRDDQMPLFRHASCRDHRYVTSGRSGMVAAARPRPRGSATQKRGLASAATGPTFCQARGLRPRGGSSWPRWCTSSPLMLWVAGVLAFVAGMPQLGVAIFVVVVVNGVFAFVQENRAEHAAERLARSAASARHGRPRRPAASRSMRPSWWSATSSCSRPAIGSPPTCA